MAEIDKEDFSDVAADYPHSNDGFDKEGRPGIYFLHISLFLIFKLDYV